MCGKFSLIPSKVQAYMAAGRPIVACLNGVGAEVVVEAGAGVTVPAEDGAALAQHGGADVGQGEGLGAYGAGAQAVGAVTNANHLPAEAGGAVDSPANGRVQTGAIAARSQDSNAFFAHYLTLMPTFEHLP